MKKNVSLIFIILLLVMAMTACSSTFDNEDVDKNTDADKSASEKKESENTNDDANVKKVLRYVKSTSAVSFDASTCYDGEGGELLYNTSEALVRYYDGKVNEGLAKEWKVSDDGLKYTFTLRDALWEDKVKVTAYDFEYSFKRFLSPEIASATASSMFMIKNAADYNGGTITDWSEVGVKAIDEKTLEITLSYTVPYFINKLASSGNLYPLREDFITKCGENYATDAENYLSCGPFKLESFNADTGIKYVKNENYWNADAIKLEGIEVIISADANTNIAMFENNEIDWYPEFAPAKFPNYGVPNFYDSGVLQFLLFNNRGTSEESGKVISNINFRRALSYAFDRDSFLKAFQGEKTVSSKAADRIALDYFKGLDEKGSFTEDFKYSGVTYNPKLAKEYLDKALKELGYSSVSELPQMTFLLFEVPAHRTYGEALLDAWNKNLGITSITATQQPVPTAIQGMFTGQFDLYFQAMSLDVDLSIFLEYWKSDSDMNFSGWSDTTYDDLYDSSLSAKTENERIQILAECEKYVLENAPMEPLFAQGNFEGLMVDGLENIKFSPISPTQYIFAYFTK